MTSPSDSSAPAPDTPAAPIWAADGVHVDKRIVDFCRGDDVALDNVLLIDDLECSRGHVRGLELAGVLTQDEANKLCFALEDLKKEHQAGTFMVTDNDEDGHSAIEAALIQRLGDIGKKVHTARSRNDQVLVATRHYMVRSLKQLAGTALACADAALSRAALTQDTLLPGYTHLQRAMPSTVGFWFAGHAECFLEDADALLDVAKWANRSPLGTAAGYGISVDLKRDEVATMLGFSGVVENGIAAQNGRGRVEAHVLSAVMNLMSSVRRLAWDLSLFTTSEFGFVKLPDRWCTGSSIMPNKKNPDVVELLRGAFAEIAAHHAHLVHATSLPSAYQRDLQVTKAPLVRGLSHALTTVTLCAELIGDVAFDADKTTAAHEPAMLATDIAVQKALEGAPFRDVYQAVKTMLADIEGDAAAYKKSVDERTSPGAPGALGLDRLRVRYEALLARGAQ